MPHLWLRHETRQTERRTAITAVDAERLVRGGATVTVEESPQRVDEIERYRAAGCRIVPAAGWFDAPDDVVVVGLKELPVLPAALRHRHVYFGHAYKNQEGAPELLRRFAAGGGMLLDAEYLTDESGRRLASFGYWAGYLGAALTILRHRGRLTTPLHPYTKDELAAALAPRPGDPVPRVLVIGAQGRCGQGAQDALAAAGLGATCWDLAETRALDKAALLDHDVLINTVLVHEPVPPFVTHLDLDSPRRLSLICDVTCDVTSDCNTLPIYQRVTSWPEPVVRLRGGEQPLDLIAIDNLPSLLPAEASIAFSAQLTPLLARLDDPADPVWERAAGEFRLAVASRTADV
ncbi:saccharopine dehydrogenase [Amorphoplanes digitatis]|uniref:Saccharopine dehydrogenase [NAD(+), L-lysine-forming] n=1 Tax=Actinoplanes digitatis TaxID=1868 RepID=A0A7W7I1P3_9ACTN|nr:saccharopine dehydrogenase [Actinoplanes digitatis]MBB4764770.1 saccharopine dehydrogenase (NAD+, L-lysine-forming) [Actinoplanes digitatis]GID91277.1 saccharopine dehydrogenase [Actinoplanes digitatis]